MSSYQYIHSEKEKKSTKATKYVRNMSQPEGKTRQHMEQMSSFKSVYSFFFFLPITLSGETILNVDKHSTVLVSFIIVQHIAIFLTLGCLFSFTFFLLENKAEIKQGSSEH